MRGTGTLLVVVGRRAAVACLMLIVFCSSLGLVRRSLVGHIRSAAAFVGTSLGRSNQFAIVAD